MAVPNSEAVQWLPSGSTRAESRSGRIGPITLGAKQTGERSAGNPHAAFDEAGAGNVARPRSCDTRRRKSEPTGNTNFGLNRRASPRPYRCPIEGCGNGATAAPLRHRQTKGAGTDMLGLTPPRHTPTLPTPAVRGAKTHRWCRWSSAITLSAADFGAARHSQRRKGITFSLSRNVRIPSSATVRSNSTKASSSLAN